MASVSREQLQEKLDQLKFEKGDEHSSSNNDSQKPGAIIIDDEETVEDNSAATQKKLLEYIEALKFDPDLTPPPVEKDSTVFVVEEILRESQEQDTTVMNKGGKRGTSKSSPRVAFSNSKTSAGANVDPNYYNPYIRSQPPQTFPPPVVASSPSKKVVKRSYTRVIREWGKRPLLIESEAPWTPRNRLYLKAVKTLANPPMQQVIGRDERSTGIPFGNPPNTVPVFSNRNAVSKWNPPYPTAAPAPVVTRISPHPYDMPGRSQQLAVAVDSPYHYQELVVPFQPPQPVLFGHLNSQGLWMPLIQQPQHQFQQPRHQKQFSRTDSYNNYPGESASSDTEKT